MTETAIQTATNIDCPGCFRKLCKLREYECGTLVEVKHKGITVLANDVIIECVSCHKTFRVNINDGLVGDIEIGRA